MYHINPNTGTPGVCRAGSPDGCPFGTLSEHHESAEGARSAYEANMSGQTLTVLKKNPQSQAQSTTNVQRPPLNRAKAQMEFDKAQVRYERAQILMDEDTALHTLTSSDLQKYKEDRDIAAAKLGFSPTDDLDNPRFRSQARPSQARQESPKPAQLAPEPVSPVNKSKARFEFDKADLKYQNAVLLMNEDMAIHNLTSSDLEKLRADRDMQAAQLGLPTTDDQAAADRNKARDERADKAAKLTQLRGNIRSADIGPKSDRSRLYAIERDLLHKYDMAQPTDPSEKREMSKLRRSIATYEAESYTESLRSLGKVTFASSRDKKETAEALRKKIHNASQIVIAVDEGRF